MISTFLASFANHLWQSTLFAAAVFLLTLALRNNRAHIRYGLWLAASIKFLIPFSLLLMAGAQFGWRPHTAAASSSILPVVVERIGEPFTNAGVPSPRPASAAPVHAGLPLSSSEALLLAVWIGGIAYVIAMRWRQWLPIKAALRAASPLAVELGNPPPPIAIWTSSANLEPGIFGLFRPVLLLPEGIGNRLTPAQFRAILVHEFCHVQRRDHLAAALHMAIETLFWFHPAIWIIGARLIEERERACDEEVLLRGNKPEDYASGILNVCRSYLESSLPCAPAITGADLNRRIEAILDKRRVLLRMTPVKKAIILAAGLLTIAGPVVIGLLSPQRTQAQTPLRFEVASIKPVKGEGGGRGGLRILPGGKLRMTGVTIRDLISFAYAVRPERVSGGPKWLDSDVYEVIADPERPATEDSPTGTFGPGTKGWGRLELRLQTLLAERCGLVIRKEEKEEAALAMVPAKGGIKLVPAPDSAMPPGTNRNAGTITGRNGTMQMLATVLTQLIGRPVIDKTGAEGGYDYKLSYADANDPNAEGPSPAVALEEQLGLRLERVRAPIATYIVERVNRPSAN